MKVNAMKRILRLVQGIALTGSLIAAAPAVHAASGNWTNLAAGNWSAAANWSSNPTVPGTAPGDVVGLTANITAARTITIDTTARTVGTLNIGDPTTAFFAYTLAASGGATLTFNNSGSAASLVQATTTAADVISAPLVLADNLTVNNTGSGGLTLSGVISGAGKGITKSGAGLFILSNGANAYTGKTILLAGTTRATTGASFGPTPGSYVADQITLNGGFLMNNTSDVTLAANQGITLGAGGGGFQAGWSRPVTVNSIITGAGGLSILSDATPGAISLNAVNTYTGPTLVGSSTAVNSWAWLFVNGSLDAASAVSVRTNGSLGGTGAVNGPVTVSTNGSVGPGGLGLPGTLTINNSASLAEAALNVDLANVTTVGAGVNDLLQVNGNLTLRGTITVNPILLKGALANGTYRLINYTGTLDAAGATLVCASPQFGATFDLSTTGQVNLIVANGAPLGLTWDGTKGPYWDTTTTNWTAGANPAKFTQGDAATFDDTGSYYNPAGLFQLYLTGPLSAVDTLFPAAVSVTTSNSFVLTSIGTAGRLGGGMALYKGGTGTLTMAHGNDSLPNIYTGPTVITNGILKVNTPRVLGPVTGGTVFATNGGTFDLNGQAMGLKPVTIQGAGFAGQGTVINSGAAQNNGLQVLTMSGDATVGGVGRFDLRGTPADTFLNTSGQPYKLTKVGPQQFSIVSATVDPAFGDVDVQQGIFSFEGNSTTLGDASKTVTVRSNATLQLWAATNQIDKKIVFQGGTTANLINGSGSNTLVGPLTVDGGSLWNIGGTSLAIYGNLDGAGGFNKSGGAPLYLYGANTHAGNTVISGNALVLGPSATLANTPSISLATGTTLDVSAVAGGFSLTSGQTLAGSGTVVGPVTAPAGSTLVPGSSPGTLTFNNALTLNHAAATFELNATPFAGNDLIVAGGLTPLGVTTLKVNPLAPLDAVNSYILFQNTGPAMPSGSEANFAVTSDSRYGFTVLPTDMSGGSLVEVKVSGGAAASLVWQGNDATQPTWWDTKVTSNWLNGAASDAFFTGDAVMFDDTASSTTVELIGTVLPSSVRLANAAKSITLSGAGSLVTASLTGDGTGTTTLANSADNTFLNGLANNSGTLGLANAGANNFGTGPVVNGGLVTLGNAGGNTLGPVTVNGGQLTIANNGPNTLGPIALNGGTLAFGQPLDVTVGSVVSGFGTLVKDGANLLVLSGANPAFEGPIQVNAGTLRAGNAAALGTTSGGTTIASGATLDVNALNLANELVTVSGAGVGGAGAVISNGGADQQNALHNVLLTGHTTFGGTRRWDIRTNSAGLADLSTGGNAYNLTKVGANFVTLVSTTVDAALADIDVQQGGFGYEVWTSSLGNPARTLNVASNAYFLMYATLNPLNKRVRLQGGSLVQSQNAANTIWGPIELPGATATIQTDVNLTLTNQVSGPGNLMKIGTATLFLNASNNLSGYLLATNGTLTVGHPEAMGSYGTVFIRRSGTTGGTGTKLGLINGLTTPTNVTAHFTTTSVGGDFRCAIGSDGGGANTWAGPIQLNGETIVGFYAGTANPLIINGTTYGTNGYTGTAFLRGGGPVTVNGQMLMPTGKFSITDNSVVTVNSVGNVWVTTQSAFGRLVVGTNNALCPTANMIIGQSGSASFLDLSGWTQEITGLATAGTAASQTIGSSSLTADSTLILNGGTNVSTYAGRIVDSVASGTMKVGLTVNSGSLFLNAANTYTGPTSVAGGVLGGTGSLASPVAVLPGGTLSPGASIGTLTVANTVTLGGTNLMEVSKTGATITSDLLTGVTTLTYGGTLKLALSGAPLAAGDSIKLYTAGTYSGAFATIEPSIPGTGLIWDTSELATTGTLKVAPDAAPALTGGSLLPDGNFALTLTGTLGQPYSVRASTNVALPLGTWTVLTNGTVPTVPFVFEDLTATNFPLRFYRTSTP